MKTDTKTLAASMDILARDIQSGDGVANAAIAEAAQRLRELERELAELKAKLPEESPTSPYVLAFAKRMEAKLEQNRHKGNREGWLNVHPFDLMKGVSEESHELHCAITRDGFGKVGTPDEVWHEAADVANMAMMVADSYESAQQAAKEGE